MARDRSACWYNVKTRHAGYERATDEIAVDTFRHAKALARELVSRWPHDLWRKRPSVVVVNQHCPGGRSRSGLYACTPKFVDGELTADCRTPGRLRGRKRSGRTRGRKKKRK